MYTKIYDIRTKFRVSQPELAKRSGVSQSQISKYEKGEIAKPSHDKLIRIAEALNCSVDDITDEFGDRCGWVSEEANKMVQEIESEMAEIEEALA